MKKNKGFTLAELLIVVAVIAVLVAVSIPVFAGQLEKGREGTDFANVRSAYSSVLTAAITEDAAAEYEGTPIKQGSIYEAVVSPLEQAKDGWNTKVENMEIGGVPSSEWQGTPGAGGSCVVRFTPAAGAVPAKTEIIWSGGASGGGPSGGGSSNGTTATALGNELVTIFNQSGSGTNASITFTVNPDGSYSIELKHTSLTEETIINKLTAAGLLTEGGVDYDVDDELYVNGYRVKITGSGKGGKIHITAL
ncbi:MAG: prepilin-type N-terminal cleavage/methylation domain-containing protein [Firmicutes bacterium]|nr:prepilin-type N-terminal cleavage/methylation domain-containing protein [Bacillota bacterium]